MPFTYKLLLIAGLDIGLALISAFAGSILFVPFFVLGFAMYKMANFIERQKETNVNE